MSPSDSWPRTHHELLQHYYGQYDEGIRSGKIQPFVYPWGTFGALFIVVYLLIPHQDRPWLCKARFLAFTWIAAFAAYSIKYTRARNMAPAFGLGFISAWSIIWIAAILVVNDAQAEFQRIERTEGVFGESKREIRLQNEHVDMIRQGESEQNGVVTNGTISGDPNALQPKRMENSSNRVAGKGHSQFPHESLGPSQRHVGFAWQPFPITPFMERLDWVLDIFCNFRGAGWNWAISSLLPPPKHIQAQLRANSSSPPQRIHRVHLGQFHVYTTRRELLLQNLKTLMVGYFILDALKTIMNHDPYFWGLTTRSPPAYFPSLLTSHLVLLKMYRLVVSMYIIKWSLQTIFSLAPLFFCGILGPSLIGARGEPWMYPEAWGSYSIVFDRGLAGWWAGWWHQTFRFVFEEPSRKILEITGMDQTAPLSKFLQLVIAFGLSGFLHACGSYTQPGDTRPIRGPMQFFLLQALGIFLEGIMRQALRRTGIQCHVPRFLMHVFTFSYVHVWFYHTSLLLCDDFAKGGIWLYEPIPFSLFRGLGFGVEGDRWWYWGGEWLRWHRGDRWWRSGIAF
ncbi:hypothetical protein K469DRAFT_700177 [Zopfia rhizophila CBS 207.26]|uniref:Wax synthase domain-containing protein n=1 Tax=Zopfia rhizophila CBS 207.26 TaxID=1314779 RepID=A0A6A6DAY4_9PEZI|nr:hypothetical protein K469DRAFT_700177 [Zopfia rhizophila CBS 207.26]